jgi:DNA-binding LacI/PurR family transcriptional regulator
MAYTAADKIASKANKIIHYIVSGEPQETTERKLAGRQILERAGFTPAEDYRLTRDDGGKEIGLTDLEPIHGNEAFTATFRGPTPTS